MGDVLRAVFLGAPGSGKGTQAERIAATLGVAAISTGEMLRRAVAEGSALGGRVEGILAAGQLVDDVLMEEVVRDRLARADVESGFVLDGYPRTPGQAGALDRILSAKRQHLAAVVLLEVPEAVLIRRALARRREDDRDEVIRERLRVYRDKTEPLVALYKERNLLRRVDGDRPLEQVTAGILSALGRS